MGRHYFLSVRVFKFDIMKEFFMIIFIGLYLVTCNLSYISVKPLFSMSSKFSIKHKLGFKPEIGISVQRVL
jgi:hypothetical protein